MMKVDGGRAVEETNQIEVSQWRSKKADMNTTSRLVDWRVGRRREITNGSYLSLDQVVSAEHVL
jgi:hypothetical protein